MHGDASTNASMDRQGAPTARTSRCARTQPPSGHVYRVKRKHGAVWYAKYRLPDGRQVQRKLGPAWSERGRPPAGYFTKRLAEDWLHDVLHQARRGTLVGMVATGATFADAVAEFLRYAEQDRQLKPSTLRGYRSIIQAHLLPAFGERPLERITSEDVEQWRAGLCAVDDPQSQASAHGGSEAGPEALSRLAHPLSNNSKNHIMVLLHGIFVHACKVWKLPVNPVAAVERYPTRLSGDIEVFSPEEVWALVRAAEFEQDAAQFLTAAFTGLRLGELIALRWRDIDFTASLVRVRSSWSVGALTTPKSGKVRSIPLAPEVARVLAKLAQRELFAGEDDLVFVGNFGSYLDDSALRRRYKRALKRAGLRQLRFHDLRHTFGTRMIAKADIRRVQEWMGHADIQTTMRYLHYAPREEDARLVAEAFQVGGVDAAAVDIS